jgi:hypothetical protein
MRPAMNSRIMSATAGVLLLVAALTACAAPEPRPSSSPDAVGPRPTETTVPVTSPTPEVPDAELTCESMISAGTVAALADAGWTAETKEFVAGGVELTEGLLCFWADYTVASDHGQLYGWSAIGDSDAASVQAALLPTVSISPRTRDTRWAQTTTATG